MRTAYLAVLAPIAFVVAGFAATGTASAQDRGYRGDNHDIVRCESKDKRRRTCAIPGGNARLVRQLSDSRCVQGRTWGTSRGSVWVSNGCRAEFSVGRGGRDGYRDERRHDDRNRPNY